MLISRFLGVSLSSQINGMLRPILVMIVIFSALIGVDRFHSIMPVPGIIEWLIFILSAGATGIVTSLSFYSGLSGDQRRSMIRRVQAAITTAESS